MIKRSKEHALALLALAVAALLFFAPLAFRPDWSLYSDHSDLIAFHAPNAWFLADSWQRDGVIPLWCPSIFGGMPFLHDIQAGTLYPPNWVFAFVPRDCAASAMSWLIVAHLIVAGWGMYLYARMNDLGVAASLVAALGATFAGKWLLHFLLAGHYALAGLAWLPWVMLGLDRAIRARSIRAAALSSIPLALLALGTHPQLTLYSGIFLLLWTPAPAIATNCSRSVMYNPILNKYRFRIRLLIAVFGSMGAVIFVTLLAVGLAAAQLFPSLEGTRLASRGVNGVQAVGGFSLKALLTTFGPSLVGPRDTSAWEPRSGFGVLAIALACLAPIVRRDVQTRYRAAVVAALVFFALGGSSLLQGLPVFKMFRLPSRMFLIAAFPVAFLCGVSTQATIDRASTFNPRIVRRALIASLLVFLIPVTIAALSARNNQLTPHPYWTSLLLTVPAFAVALRSRRRGPAWQAVWISIFAIDLVTLTRPYLAVRDWAELMQPSDCVRFVAENSTPGHERVLERSLPDHHSSSPLGHAIAITERVESLRGYNPFDVYSYKSYINNISTSRSVNASSATRQSYNGIGNFAIVNKSSLDLLGVRWLTQPKAVASLGLDDGPLDATTGWRKAFEDSAPVAYQFAAGGMRSLPPYEVYENLDAFPRAFVARADDVRIDPRGDATLKDGLRRASVQPAPIATYQANRVLIDISAASDGWLVLCDVWYPGWSVSVDERPAFIARVNGLFRGVSLTPGPHRVEFRFQPEAYRIGKFASGFTALAILLLVLLPSRRTASRESTPAPIVPHSHISVLNDHFPGRQQSTAQRS